MEIQEPNIQRMYRKHGPDYVVDIDNVWPLISVSDPTYQAWLAAGNQPLEQDDD